VATSEHFLGDHLSARRRFERLLAHYVPSDRHSRLTRFPFDNLVVGRGYLARTLWLLGYPDQAMRAAESSIDTARAINHALTLCFALTFIGCPVALLVGDLAMAEFYVHLLLDHSKRHGLDLWRGYGRSDSSKSASRYPTVGRPRRHVAHFEDCVSPPLDCCRRSAKKPGDIASSTRSRRWGSRRWRTGWMWGGTEEQQSIATIHAALERGITMIDTAPAYGFGRAEEIVGRVLAEGGRREKVLIATKVGLNWRDRQVFRDGSSHRIRQEIEDSLRRLQTDRIDLLSGALARRLRADRGDCAGAGPAPAGW
jgi:hypothetical protein